MSYDGELYIGMMSGTSVDGIDATLVNIRSATELQVIETQFTEFPEQLRNKINAIAQSNNHLTNCADSELHVELASYYAKASLALIKKAGVNSSEIRAIANHGQTVRHEPNASPAFSIQLGDPQAIANQTKIPCIGYFRQADLAAGGQGAPLMPAFHKAVLTSKENSNNFVLNIGGIANITQLGDHVIGFDTGPGNTLLDQWIGLHQGKKYDKDGAWSQSGKVIPELLDQLLKDDYFSTPFPKSTGPDHFNLDWLRKQSDNIKKYKPADVQATLLSLTTQTIVDCLKELNGNDHCNVFICGGGAHNKAMVQALNKALNNASISTTDSIGIPADWVEAAGFAWLGYCHIHNLPSNLPSVTGASKSLVLGELFTPQ